MPRGGKREGAGRPSGTKWLPETKRFRAEAVGRLRALAGSDRDPLDQVISMVLNDDLDVQTRLSTASIALPYLYPRLSATTVDSRSTVVKIDGGALLEKINARLERLVEMPATIIEAAAPSDQLIALSEAAD